MNLQVGYPDELPSKSCSRSRSRKVRLEGIKIQVPQSFEISCLEKTSLEKLDLVLSGCTNDNQIEILANTQRKNHSFIHTYMHAYIHTYEQTYIRGLCRYLSLVRCIHAYTHIHLHMHIYIYMYIEEETLKL